MRRLALLVSALAAVVPAQEPIRITAHTVQVHAVVRYSKGLPIRDLTRDDFTVYDEKTKQEIKFFSKEWRKMDPASTPLPPNTFTNRIEQRTDVPSAVTVVLFDQKNTEWDRQHYCKQQVLKALRGADPEHRIALYALTDKLRILHDFTSNPEWLISALAGAPIQLTNPNGHGVGVQQLPRTPSSGVVKPEPADHKEELAMLLAEREELMAWMENGETRFAGLELRGRVLETALALEAIALRLSRIPGRKNLVWVSGSFPFSFTLPGLLKEDWRPPEDLRRELDRVTRSLTAASISVYPVYAGSSGVPGVASAGDQYSRRVDMAEARNSQTGMRMLAEGTGGRLFMSIDGFPDALKSAGDDSRDTYVLGYTPSHNEWNGKFRRIRVEVNRRGAHVRYRAGYIASADRTETPGERTEVLRDAVWSPLDATGLNLDVKVEAGAKEGSLRLMTLLDSQAVLFAAAGNRYTGALDVLYVQEGFDGRNLSGVRDEIKLNMTSEAHEAMLKKKHVGFRKEIERVPEANRLRVVVRDPASGLIGAVTVPLKR